MEFDLIFGIVILIYFLLLFFLGAIKYVGMPIYAFFRPWNYKNPDNKRQKESSDCRSKGLHYILIKKFPEIYRRRDYIRYFLLFDLVESWNAYKLATKYPEYMSDGVHDGIVIVHENIAKWSFYGEGVKYLITFFRKPEISIPYKIYHCENLERFKEVVRNPAVTSLWIFGHGNHGGIGCGVHSLVYETEFSPPPITPKKAYIYQFHCNGGCGKSLAEILSNGRGFVDHRDHDPFINEISVKQILQRF